MQDARLKRTIKQHAKDVNTGFNQEMFADNLEIAYSHQPPLMTAKPEISTETLKSSEVLGHFHGHERKNCTFIYTTYIQQISKDLYISKLLSGLFPGFLVSCFISVDERIEGR